MCPLDSPSNSNERNESKDSGEKASQRIGDILKMSSVAIGVTLGVLGGVLVKEVTGSETAAGLTSVAGGIAGVVALAYFLMRKPRT
jgi:hypothetical protein